VNNNVDQVFDQKGKDIKIEVTLSFHEAIKGTIKGVVIEREVKCPSWEGKRGATEEDISICYSCNGGGVKKDHLFGNMTKWNTCNGHGRIIKNLWETCTGTGLVKKEFTERIAIPPLTESNDFVKTDYSGNHSEYIKGKQGDLIVKTIVEDDDIFQRKGFDVYSILPITLADALIGTQIPINTLSGDTHYIQIKKGTMHKEIIVLEGRGIFDEVSQTAGNHYLRVFIDMPKKITPEFEEIIRVCFK
jgi:molecular chaperone DnaJ